MKSPKQIVRDIYNTRRNARRRLAREQRKATQPQPLDLCEIAADVPLRLYNKPVTVPRSNQPAICPTCGEPLVIISHRNLAVLICEPCCRVWPTRIDAGATVPKIVKAIIPLAEINIRRKGNERDYQRVYRAKNHEKALVYERTWRETLPEQGKRYGRAYYQANRERVNERTLANYHANKDERKAKNKEYRQNNRDKDRERHRRWKEQNPEKHQATTRAYEERTRERRYALAKARREADPEKHREYHREYQRRKAAEKRAARDQEQAAD